MPKKRKISVDEKLKIITRLKSGESLNKLEKVTGYQRSQIRRWARNENKLLEVKDKSYRIKGGGRKPIYGKIEEELFGWFNEQRRKKLVINYSSVREKAKRIAETVYDEDSSFSCSNHWIRNFCRRHRICSRKVTHVSQQQNTSNDELVGRVNDFLRSARQMTTTIAPSNIYNMDETPCYFDMAHNRTLHFKGEKTIDGLDTGHSKNRFTVILCVSADGKFIRSMIIFKGLKKIPKVIAPKNVEVTVSKGGSTYSQLMKHWITTCFARRNGPFSNQKSVLLLDSFKAHTKPDIMEYLKDKCNTEVIYIPPKTTSFFTAARRFNKCTI